MIKNKIDVFKFADPREFDTEHYEGMFILPQSEGTPVIIQRSKSADPPHWCVVDGYSNSIFYTYRDVIDYCTKQGWL